MALLKILSILTLLVSTHLDWFYEGESFASYWFILNAISLYTLSISKSNILWINDISKGYFLGYLIEVIRCHYLGHEENHIGEILLLCFGFIGYFWRKYKDKTVTIAMITSIGTGLKWAITKVLTLLFS